MCLIVTDTPSNKLDGLIGVGYKLLQKDFYRHYYFTPFMRIRIPDDGWLIASNQRKKKSYLYNDIIYGGYIHYYLKQLHGTRYKAFTFFNCAYEHEIEGVCRAMYIPQCDRTKSNTTSTINRLLDRHKKGTLRTNDIVKAFPFLNKSYEIYKVAKFF